MKKLTLMVMLSLSFMITAFTTETNANFVQEISSMTCGSPGLVYMYGQITDQYSNQIKSAQVVLKEAAGGTVCGSGTSNTSGNYATSNVFTDLYVINVNKIGCTQYVGSISLYDIIERNIQIECF